MEFTVKGSWSVFYKLLVTWPLIDSNKLLPLCPWVSPLTVASGC